jgi:hypothetical protein
MEVQPLRRRYTCADSFLLQSANAICTLLGQDLADFSAFDASFSPAFVSNFEGLIDAAQSLASDDLVIDQVAAKSEEVEQAWATACSKYGQLRYFVLKAFPHSKGVQNQFGLGSYSSHARRSAARMLRLLQDMHSVATSYQAELLAVGYTLAQIAAIETIRQQLEAALNAQSLALKERPKTTAERISALNACYECMASVNAAAQIVYMTEAAKRKQYTFYPSRERKKPATTKVEASSESLPA